LYFILFPLQKILLSSFLSPAGKRGG